MSSSEEREITPLLTMIGDETPIHSITVVQEGRLILISHQGKKGLQLLDIEGMTTPKTTVTAWSEKYSYLDLHAIDMSLGVTGGNQKR